VIAGLNWLASNRVLPAVANLSFGLPYDPALNQAVANVINAGVTVTASSGNADVDACQVSPAGVTGAITVGIVSDLDVVTSYPSNWGPCIDLYAPGTNIISAWATGDNVQYSQSGSSASAAFAAGAAAMYLEANPSASPAMVANALISTATTGVLVGLNAQSPNRLLYTGPAGGTGTTETPPPIDNPPSARISVSCRKTVCTFNGGSSTDDHGIVQYSWSFGDAATGAGLTATHTYGASGTYTVNLTVLDTANQSGVGTYSLRVSTKGR